MPSRLRFVLLPVCAALLAVAAAHAQSPVLLGAASRLAHAGLGDIDLALDLAVPLAGNVAIEPRAPGGAVVVVLRFDIPITASGTLAVTDEAGTAVPATATVAGNEVRVSIPPPWDARRFAVTLAGINGTGATAGVALGVLMGGAGGPHVSDATVAAAKQQNLRPLDAANARFDLNRSGTINAADLAAFRARRGAELSPIPGSPWAQFAREPRHQAVSPMASQALGALRWSAPVDLAPQYTGNLLFAHYGPPVITPRHTVVMPVKTGPAGGFRLEARSGATGAVKWTLPTDYLLPAHHWVPAYNATLAGNRVYAAASGGRLAWRENPDALTGATGVITYYGDAVHAAAPAAYAGSVYVNTPITADAAGNLFFGVSVSGSNPAGLVSGVVKVAPDGSAGWIDLAAMLGAEAAQVSMNSAPALSPDGATLYVAVRTSTSFPTTTTSRLVALDANNLSFKSQAHLFDPAGGGYAFLTDNATASPLVGPDGDVFIGVLGVGAGHSQTGWLLHYDATLSTTKVPGAFGWDNTPSVVPRAMVPGYAGAAAYLILSKYNSYFDGQHRVAILDPTDFQFDGVSGVPVMREVMTRLSETPAPGSPGRFTEWCINTAAVDPATQSVLMNNEDGYLYRWHLPTNTFSERIPLGPARGQSYTATAIGPDGTVYAVNNGTLHAVGN